MHNLHILRQLVFTTGICLIILSCGKEKNAPTDFKINGINDIVLEENGSQVLDLNVELLSTNAEQVTLTTKNVPEGLTLSFNRTTDKPPFDATLHIKDDSTKGGVYNISLVGTSATGLMHSYDFTITTSEKTCAKKASGLYHGTSTCRDGNGLIFGDMYFSVDSNNKDKLFFIWNNTAVYGIVNCNRNLITIPLQSVGTYKFSGEGYLDKNYTLIDFDYIERYSNGDTISCNAYFVKK